MAGRKPVTISMSAMPLTLTWGQTAASRARAAGSRRVQTSKEEDAMSLIAIGEFSHRTRLSPKALRLYDQLGLVVPARVDAFSGYRFYSPDQVESARLVGMQGPGQLPRSNAHRTG